MLVLAHCYSHQPHVAFLASEIIISLTEVSVLRPLSAVQETNQKILTFSKLSFFLLVSCTADEGLRTETFC